MNEAGEFPPCLVDVTQAGGLRDLHTSTTRDLRRPLHALTPAVISSHRRGEGTGHYLSIQYSYQNRSTRRQDNNCRYSPAGTYSVSADEPEM